MELPKRKSPRLNDYDYSKNGYYFITICTQDKACILSKIIVGDGFHAVPTLELTQIGVEIQNAIAFINQSNKNIEIEKYIIMPNHIHLIVVLFGEEAGGRGNPPLHSVIGQIKSYTNKRYNEIMNTTKQKMWQRSYHDHIIRGERDYLKIYNYIENNHLKWNEDCHNPNSGKEKVRI
jgi:REP element-mobilizing transposase RayT